MEKYLVAEFNLQVRFVAFSWAEDTKLEVSFYVDKESGFAGLVETVKKAIEEGAPLLEAKKMLEDGGLITIYKENQFPQGSWRGISPDGWKDYYYYEDPGIRQSIRIRCPQCKSEAEFNLFDRWVGLIRCYNCHFHDVWEMDWSRFHDAVDPKAKILRWPEDAYFQWDIRGTLLWAYNREHARAILDFIASRERREEDFPKFCKSLQTLPAEIVSAKTRDLVVRRISQTLQFSQNKITP